MRIGIRTLLPHQFYLCIVQYYVFYQAFLNLTYSVWRKYINQSWPPHKKDFLLKVLILDLIGLNVCITFIRL